MMGEDICNFVGVTVQNYLDPDLFHSSGLFLDLVFVSNAKTVKCEFVITHGIFCVLAVLSSQSNKDINVILRKIYRSSSLCVPSR